MALYGKGKGSVDYETPGTTTPSKLFKKRVEDMEQDCKKTKQPYCRACAWNLFNNQLKLMKDDAINAGRAFRESAPEVLELATKFDMKQFIGEDKFVLLDIKDAHEPRVVDGKRTSVHVGFYMDYQCKKIEMHACSVFLTVEEYEKLQAKKKKKAVAPAE